MTVPSSSSPPLVFRFDRFIIMFIAFNSLMLALTDYDTINMNPSAANYGEPTAKGSALNTLSGNASGLNTTIVPGPLPIPSTL